MLKGDGDTLLVEPFVIHGLEWKVMLAKKRLGTLSTGVHIETAALHIECNSGVTTRWGCVYAEAEMCILPFEKNLTSVIMQTEYIFSLEVKIDSK